MCTVCVNSVPKCTVNSIFIFFLIYKKKNQSHGHFKRLKRFKGVFFGIMHIKLLLLEQLCSDQYNTNKTVTETNGPVECFIYTLRAVRTSTTCVLLGYMQASTI